MLKKIKLFSAVILCGAMMLTAGTSIVSASSIDKNEIEKIIHNYIMENPKVILQAVQQYQDKSSSEKREVALKRNKKLLFNDKNTPQVGNPNADVTVVEFFDYNCGYCKRVWPDVAKLLKKDPNIRVVFKEYPILGPSSEKAARWALAAHKQGKYLEFHTELLEGKGAITENKLVKIAKKLDLNVARLKQDADSNDVTAQIQKTRALALDLDITGTPAFLIDETVLPGAVTYEQLRSIIEEKRNANKNK